MCVLVVCTGIWVRAGTGACSYRKMPEEGIRTPREEAAGGCRLPDVGAVVPEVHTINC